MTENQALSQMEQMEAARRDFEKEWNERIYPEIEGLMAPVEDHRAVGLAYHVAWLSFLCGLRINKKAATKG